MQRRSTTIFIIGLLTLVLGAATTFAALHGSKKAAADTGRSAKAPLAAPVPGQPSGFTIPTGKQAIAVALDQVAGTAGTAVQGSHIDVFAAVTDKKNGADVHEAKLVLQDVEVLSIPGSGAVLPGKAGAVAAPAPTGSNTTFVLAVTAQQAEMLVFHASFSKMWFTVLPAGAKPVPNTPGVDNTTQLNPVAGA